MSCGPFSVFLYQGEMPACCPVPAWRMSQVKEERERGLAETNQRPALGSLQYKKGRWEYRVYEDVCNGAHLLVSIGIAGKPNRNAWQEMSAPSAVVFKIGQQDPM